MADKIIQLHDELGNNIYPITTIDALYGSGALANVFVDKKGDTMVGNLIAPKFIGALQGNADSASKVNNSLSIQLNGGTATAFDGSVARSINITPAAIGAAAASHGTHVTYSTTDPVMDGTASVGSAATVARSDHRHPIDTSRAAVSDLTAHTGNTTIHITVTERTNWNAAKTHADSAHAPSNAEANQNAFSNIVIGSTTIAANTKTDSLTLVGSNVTLTPDATNDKVTIGITKENVTTALGYTPPTQDTTYSAGTGISLSGTTINNSGVRSIATGSANGTISVNTDGTAADVAVKGLGSAAYTESSAYAAASHSHSYLPLTGGTVTGDTTFQKDLYVAGNVHFRVAESVTSGTAAGVRNSLCIYGTTYGNDAAYIKTAGKLSYGDPGPQIIFGTSDALGSAQKCALIYTDHDTIATGNSLSLVSTEANCAFIAPKVYGAVWNDYAEFRICNEDFKPGHVVSENGDDTLSIATNRLQRGCSIISDTFGFAIGETDEAKCPIAVSGRVLAYGYESREEFKKHIGWPVCSGPNGTVSIMTEEEEEKYPSRIIGTISAVPDYETWGTGNVEVNNRIWIKIK